MRNKARGGENVVLANKTFGSNNEEGSSGWKQKTESESAVGGVQRGCRVSS
jgi:hypothetical protein